eukprot:6559036-Pyramimonas_sp.AAC.1
MMRRGGTYSLPPRRVTQSSSSHSTPSLYIFTATGANPESILSLNVGCQGAKGRRNPTHHANLKLGLPRRNDWVVRLTPKRLG